MNVSILIASFKYQRRSFNLYVSLAKWINNELTKIKYSDNKLLVSFHKEDFEVSEAIICFVIDKKTIKKLINESLRPYLSSDTIYKRLELLLPLRFKESVDILNYACSQGYVKVVMLILHLDPNIYYGDALLCARDENRHDIIKLLSKHSCINNKNKLL